MRRSREVVLTGATPAGEGVSLRPVRRGDRAEFIALRERNADWLRPWDPTVPPGGPARRDIAADFGGYVRALRAEARSGGGLSLLIVVGGRIVGMVSASSIVEGALRSASIGYWVGREVAGRGIAPTAVAMIADHLMDPQGRNLHRVQLEIRPENAPSLVVATKLGLREEGVRRAYLHIDGDWRDHRSFAVVREELGPGGLMARLSHQHHPSRTRHTE
ncbi:GNAT family N-acetyltransferase [Janibacter sp. G349]|uniref:GNAT family N-acetyltransferase n=1 Tax=unclassified Janibacter TaxID=2649294 RepID=UPI0020CFA69D|nr:GNAT family protein [Janibacter sp. CX7]UTT66516.1 GNAT family N-acetyltransferase [Janibacter sp. CX7]